MSFKLSLRVHVPIWEDDANLAVLMRGLDECPGLFEEVALFTSQTHAPLPLARIKQLSERLKVVVPQFKARGLITGINHLPTIGHLEENAPNSLNEPWQRLVDKSGAVSVGCYCPSDPDMQGYIRDCYAALASSKPDFIWVDDDLRMESHTPMISFACFCPRCLAKFSAETGRDWTRETLVEAFAKAEPLADRLALRRKWLDHNHAVVTDTLKLIRSAVDGVDDSIMLGLMTGEINYSGYLDKDWFDAMSGPKHREVKHRPGGGFYLDDVPGQMVDKLFSIGRQMSFLPKAVADVQYEHENFPYHGLGKSRTVFTAEISGALGVGCTGAALNVLDITGSNIDESLPFLKATAKMRPFYEQVVETCGQSACEGLWTPFTAKHFASMAPDGEWPGWGGWGGDMNGVMGLCRFGTPAAFTRESALGALVLPHSRCEWNAEDYRAMLAKGAIIDCAMLEYLNSLGLGELTGWKVVGKRTMDMRERFLDDPLNGDGAGRIRDCRPSFWPQETALLEPTNAAARPLAEAIDFNMASLGICEGVFENSLGGRIAVLGHYPWDMLSGKAKVAQLQNIADWVAHGALPIQVTSFHKIVAFARRDPQGRPAALLLNISNDPAEEVKLRYRHGEPQKLGLLVDDGHWEMLCKQRDWNGGEVTVTIPSIPPWHAALVRVP